MVEVLRVRAAFMAAAILAFAPTVASADTGPAEAFGRAVSAPASEAIRRFEADRVAQARPAGEREAPLQRPQLPQGVSYSIDVSAAYALGRTGSDNRLPGGADGVIGYAFSRYQRVQAAYYDLQEYPIGFNTGVVPVYLQGTATPIATSDLSVNPVNVTVKNRIFTASFQNLFVIAKKFPIVVSPTYTARTGKIGGGSDLFTVEIDGFPQTVPLRTVQFKQVAFTLPFISSPKMFATYTVAPSWLVQRQGANETNHAQLLHLLYVEYRPTQRATIFFQPSLLPNYLANDKFPQHTPTFVYGASAKTTKTTFVQAVVSAGGAANIKPYGVYAVTCQQITCAPNQLAPSLAGLKAAQVQLKFGFGSPSVIPL